VSVQIRWSHLDEVEADERSAVERRLMQLAEGHDDLIEVRVIGRGSRHHRRGAREVRIAARARGRELVAARTRDVAGLALNEALDAFEREVLKLRSRRQDRRTERPALPPHLGIVDRLFRAEGYGFVLTDSGEQVYFHRNAVHAAAGFSFETLEEGQRVGLNVEQGREGLQATTLVPAPPDAPSP
jgi:cold shock CspA family protein/ribosome-associated translation inhibitor RaiA